MSQPIPITLADLEKALAAMLYEWGAYEHLDVDELAQKVFETLVVNYEKALLVADAPRCTCGTSMTCLVHGIAIRRTTA